MRTNRSTSAIRGPCSRLPSSHFSRSVGAAAGLAIAWAAFLRPRSAWDRRSEARRQTHPEQRLALIGLTGVRPGEAVEVTQHVAGLLGGEVVAPGRDREALVRAEVVVHR